MSENLQRYGFIQVIEKLRDARFADLALLEFWGNWALPIVMLLATFLHIIAYGSWRKIGEHQIIWY